MLLLLFHERSFLLPDSVYIKAMKYNRYYIVLTVESCCMMLRMEIYAKKVKNSFSRFPQRVHESRGSNSGKLRSNQGIHGVAHSNLKIPTYCIPIITRASRASIIQLPIISLIIYADIDFEFLRFLRDYGVLSVKDLCKSYSTL